LLDDFSNLNIDGINLQACKEESNPDVLFTLALYVEISSTIGDHYMRVFVIVLMKIPCNKG